LCERRNVQRRSRGNHARLGAASLVRRRRGPCSAGVVATPVPGRMALSLPRKDGRTGHRPQWAAPSRRRTVGHRAWPRGSPGVAAAQSCPCPPARATPYPVAVVRRIAHAHPDPAPALFASTDAITDAIEQGAPVPRRVPCYESSAPCPSCACGSASCSAASWPSICRRSGDGTCAARGPGRTSLPRPR